MAHPALAATLPSEAEAGLAKETSRLLASRLKKGAPMKFRMIASNSNAMRISLSISETIRACLGPGGRE